MKTHAADAGFRWVAIGFFVLGLGLLAGSALLYQHTRSFLATAVSASATIVEHRQTSTAKENRYISVYQFTTPHDQRVTFSLYNTSGWSNPVGASVPILYDPAVPQDARLDTGWARWTWPVILGVLGVGFAAWACTRCACSACFRAQTGSKAAHLRAQEAVEHVLHHT